jgi:glutathione S-transferase
VLNVAAAAFDACSTTIVEYLAAAYPDSGTPLMPPDAYTAARVKLFSRYFAVRPAQRKQQQPYITARQFNQTELLRM